MTPLNNLIHVTRWSGTQLIKSESVADHVWGMNALALSEVPDLNKKRSKLGLRLINLKELIYKITIHDIDEAFYCDIPRLFKHYNEEILTIIDKTAHELMNKNLISELVADIDNAKNDTLEGFYVKIFDFIQAGQKMVNEIELGNQYMACELPNVIECLELIVDEISDKDYNKVEVEFIQKYLKEFKNNLIGNNE